MRLQLPPRHVGILIDGLMPSFVMIDGVNDLDLTREMMTFVFRRSGWQNMSRLSGTGKMFHLYQGDRLQSRNKIISPVAYLGSYAIDHKSRLQLTGHRDVLVLIKI